VFLSAVCYALFLVGQGRLVHRYGPRFFAAGCMLFSFAAYFVQFFIAYPITALAQPRPVILMSAFTALFCNVVPTFLFAYAMKLAGAGPTAVAGTVGPVSTLILSAWLLGERPEWPQIAGLALVVTGALRLAAGKPAGPQDPGPRSGASPSGFSVRASSGGVLPASAKGASASVARGDTPSPSRARGKPVPWEGMPAPSKGKVPPELSDPAASAAAFLASAKGGGSTLWGRGRSHSRSA
jgi:uncharacterized membrane protein